MPDGKQDSGRGIVKYAVWVQELVLFLGGFLYLLNTIHPILILESYPSSVFLKDKYFFNEFTHREDTQFTRLYLSHIDPGGNSSKAFIIPQEDAAFYETCLEIYNVPEFVREPIKVTPQQLADAAYLEEEMISANPASEKK